MRHGLFIIYSWYLYELRFAERAGSLVLKPLPPPPKHTYIYKFKIAANTAHASLSCVLKHKILANQLSVCKLLSRLNARHVLRRVQTICYKPPSHQACVRFRGTHAADHHR